MIKRTLSQKLKKELLFAVGSPAIIWQVLFFYIPLTFLFTTSFFSEGRFGLGNFLPFLSGPYLTIILSSLGLSFFCAALCSLIGYPLAYFIALRSGRYKTLFLFLLIVPSWTNFLLHVYSWFFVLEREGFLNTVLSLFLSEPLHVLNSLFAVVLMMVYCYLPFVVLPLYSALERFDLHLLDAAQDLGATWHHTFFHIMLPLTLTSLRTGFFLVFIPAYGEFIIPELMGGDRLYFVGSVISQYILGQKTANLGAAFTLISSLSLISAIVAIYLGFKKLNHYLQGKRY